MEDEKSFKYSLSEVTSFETLSIPFFEKEICTIIAS